MKHLIAIFLGLISLVGIYFFVQYNSQPLSFTLSHNTPSPTQSKKIVQGSYKKFLFVPYWAIGTKKIPEEYDDIIYFGITPTPSGVDLTEDGYKNIPAFIRRAS